MSTDRRHPLRRLLNDAAEGRFPPADFSVEVLSSPPGRSDAVVAFSAHNVIAASLQADEVHARLTDDDPATPMSAPFLAWLGRRLDASPGALDMVMVAPRSPEPGQRLSLATDTAGHARVERAQRYRSDVQVYRSDDGHGLVILGRGLADRWEVSIEVEPASRGRGLGRELAVAAASLVPAGEPLFAQVSPGNVASVRAFLAAGYHPICSEVLFLRR
ncbi:MAG TPA: GNAT family N-acetyltransferase [Candidatus Limnocylindria bacterium]|nr:GNAT family N-acetyltransferase [Candidatus Limnocylindria bacterium]